MSSVKKPLIAIIKTKIGPGKAFSLQDIAPYAEMTPGALKEAAHRLAKAHEIVRLGYGVYMLSPNKLTEKEKRDAFLTYRYLGSDKNPIGFFYGECYILQILHQPFPEDSLDIVSNKVTSGKKITYKWGQTIVLRKPFVKVTYDNIAMVAFLTYLSQATESDLKRNYAVLANYVRETHLAAPDATDLLPYFPSKTAVTLLSNGLYKLMWKH